MSHQLAVGVFTLLHTSVECVVDAVELVPHVGGAGLHQGVHLTTKFHRELALLPGPFQILLREVLPAGGHRQTASHRHNS